MPMGRGDNSTMNKTRLAFIAGLMTLTLLTPALRADYFNKIESRLFLVEDGKKVDFKKPAKNPQFTAIYYSAHWCPPCRAFTPKLVDWYKEFKAKHDNFELVFVSSDKSEEAQIEYIKEVGMPWPAAKLASKSDPNFKKYAAGGIPYLVLIDENGKDLTGKKDNDWQHPTEVLKKIEELVK
jgi:nucleoredoxin